MRLLFLLHLIFIIEAKPKKAKLRSQSRPGKSNVNTNPDIYDNTVPIDFLNMGVSGVYDPSLGQKQPYDGLATYLVHDSKSDVDLRTILQQLSAARDLHKPPSKPTQSKDTADLPGLYDFETIHALNLAKPQIYKARVSKTELLFKQGSRQNSTNPEDPKPLEDIVPLNMFDMKAGVNEDVIRWTSCDDFAKKARFHPRDVAGVDWVPFYLWSMQTYPIPEEFKFSYPTRKVVQEYKEQYASKLTKKIDWTAPMLLLRNWLEMLLVAGDKRGLFYGIPKSAIPDEIRNSTTWYPHATIRMKMVDNYLALMFCEEHLAMMLAVAGEEPDPHESAAEAAKLGFHGIGAPVTKQGQVGAPKDDRFEDFEEKMNLDRHSAVDLRGHPLATYLALDLIYLVLLSVYPGVWGALPLTEDLYVAFVAIASKKADLRMLKQLAKNSIKYSALNVEKKANLFKTFDKKSLEFINYIVDD